MKVQNLLLSLEANEEISKLIALLSQEIQSRNTFPMQLMQFYSGKSIDGDSLTQYYNRVLKLIRPYLTQMDLSDNALQAIHAQKDHQLLNQAIWFATDKETNAIRIEILNCWIVAILLQKVSPDIDKYVEATDNTSLLEELNITYDSNFLIDISGDEFELRKHGLLISSDKLVYPHQFMRRYYHANFVDLLSILAYCKKQGHDVKIRLDPLRRYCAPRFYKNLIEADHWHGEPFAESLLMSKERKEKLTFHQSYDNQTISAYPVKYTIFRSSMMDAAKDLRQFMIEEYTPSEVQENSISDKAPGFGDKYCIQKFAHFVFDQRQGSFTHIDGATRTFTKAEYASVESIVKKGQDPGSKIGTRDKLFLVEGSIERSLIFDLLYEFFRYNPHLQEYFSLPKS